LIVSWEGVDNLLRWNFEGSFFVLLVVEESFKIVVWRSVGSEKTEKFREELQ
jgi:hypothetical protein